MDKKTSSPAQKRSRRPPRFQVDPLSVPSSQDFPVTAEGVPQRFSEAEDNEESTSQKIELLPLNMVEPDPWNPRHILPEKIRQKLIEKKIDAEAAVKAWVKASKSDNELAEQIHQFINLGASLQQQGQINPVNVAKHFSEDGVFKWRIESGERRYWAKWLLIVESGAKDRTIHAVLRDELDPVRQAVENLQTESLSAVGEARQIARLFLDGLEITPENQIAQEQSSGGNDFFRIALRPAGELIAGRKRLPRGYWPKLEKIIGVKRQHLERKLQVLRLPDDLLSMAEKHRLTERQLRAIISRPESQWKKLIHITVKHNLTGTELASISTTGNLDNSVKIILENRSSKVISKTGVKAEAGKQKSKRHKHPLEDEIHNKVTSFAKYMSKKSIGEKVDLNLVADEIINSGNQQVVLDSLTQIEILVSHLKSKIDKTSGKK